MDAAAYARQLKQLLPPGRLWNLEPGSWLERTLLAIADELARIDARASQLVDEWDPSTATETLEDWERMLGIPDEETPLAETVAERRFHVARKWRARGGQSRAYFIDLAEWAGCSVAIVETAPHTWRMDVSPPYAAETKRFRTGLSRVGERLFVRGDAEFEAIVNRWKPAHTVLVFNYL
jgi:uncharacterized protein YmfQ (DUF2313 family)